MNENIDIKARVDRELSLMSANGTRPEIIQLNLVHRTLFANQLDTLPEKLFESEGIRIQSVGPSGQSAISSIESNSAPVSVVI